LIDGEPVAMAPGDDTHGSLQAEIARLLGNHLIAQASFCRADQAGCGERCEGLMPEPVLLFDIISDADEADTSANTWALRAFPP
jgi:Putative restriction endonuclease